MRDKRRSGEDVLRTSRGTQGEGQGSSEGRRRVEGDAEIHSGKGNGRRKKDEKKKKKKRRCNSKLKTRVTHPSEHRDRLVQA